MTVALRVAWWEAAACRGKPVVMFIHHDAGVDTTREALAICRDCPVRVECLEDCFAFGTSLPGIYGGTTQHDRINRGKARLIAARRTPSSFEWREQNGGHLRRRRRTA